MGGTLAKAPDPSNNISSPPGLEDLLWLEKLARRLSSDAALADDACRPFGCRPDSHRAKWIERRSPDCFDARFG